jgi:hypothetical protein
MSITNTEDEIGTDIIDQMMPDRNVTIKIIGLALSLFDSTNGWSIYFPKAEHHIFKLEVTKKIGDKDIYTNVIRFNTDNSSFNEITILGDTTKTPTQPNLQLQSSAFSLASIHGKIDLDIDKSKYTGFLNLQGADLFAEAIDINDPNEFEVWKTTPFNNPTRKELVQALDGSNTWKIANGFSSGFNMVASNLIIGLKNSLGFDLNLDFDKDVSYEITVFNECEGNCSDISDFKFYYNIIDTSSFANKYELILKTDGGGDKRRIAGCAGIIGGQVGTRPQPTP